MNQTISSQLYDPVPTSDPLLKILLTVTINSTGGNYAFSKYSNERGDFFTVNPRSHVSVRYTPKDTPWDKHHQVVITQRNIYQLRLGLKKFYRIFQRDNLYQYDHLGRLVGISVDEDRDVVVIPLGMGQLIRFTPTVVTDRKNILYPGVNITINLEENQADLSIEEFEGIYDLFQTLDIYQAGLILLQTYIGMRKTPVEQTMNDMEKNKPPRTRRPEGGTGGSLFENKEYMKAPPTVEIPKTLDEL